MFVKRFFCMVVVCVILLGLLSAQDTASAVVLENSCPDHFVEITEPTDEIEYRYYSFDSHKCYQIYIGICYTCESVERVGQYLLTEEHKWYYVDGGHLPGKLKHNRNKLCPICEFQIVELLNCPGPENGGCIVIMNRVNDETVQQ